MGGESMHFLSLTLLVLLISLSSSEGRRLRSEDEDKEEMDKLLDKMVDAVDQATDFFASDYSNINLDGLFGMRIGQGQIIDAARECNSSATCPAALLHRLEALIQKIDVTGDTSLSYVEVQDPAYLERFLPTVNNAYMIRYVPVRWPETPVSQVGTNRMYNESVGDICYGRIFGTHKENGKAVSRCNTTDMCWDVMTLKDTYAYTKTHQLLYFILLEKTGCVDVVQKEMGTTVREKEDRICRSIYSEVVREVKEGAVKNYVQDLYLEQVVLCGILGFEDFLRTDWMRMVLTWQKSSGCFSSIEIVWMQRLSEEQLNTDLKEKEKEEEQEEEEEEEEERLVMQDLRHEAQMIESQRHGRKLLRENLMSDGCLSHKSGLGFGTLALYTRYLVRQLYLEE